MRVVDIAHFEPGPLTRKATGPQRGDAPFVGDLGKWVGLVHKLRKLAGAEESVEHRGDDARVDQVLRREALRFARAHAFANRALHAAEGYGELVGKLLTHRADTAVAKMINIVRPFFALAHFNEVAAGLNKIVRDKHRGINGCVQVEFFVDPVASHLPQIVLFCGEEHAFDEFLGHIDAGRFAGAQIAIKSGQRLFPTGSGVLFHRVKDHFDAHIVIQSQQGHHLDARFSEGRVIFRGEFPSRFGDDFAGIGVDDVRREGTAFEFLRIARLYRQILDQVKRAKHLFIGSVPDGPQ